MRSLFLIKLLRLLFIIIFTITSKIAVSETIAVIGTGMMGGSIGPQLANLGHTVIYGSRNPENERIQKLLKRTSPSAKAFSQIKASNLSERKLRLKGTPMKLQIFAYIDVSSIGLSVSSDGTLTSY